MVLCAQQTRTVVSQGETAKTSMDAEDFGAEYPRMHNFRVTRLCMGCTRLMNKKLQLHEFY
jgi:hypothetical protein